METTDLLIVLGYFVIVLLIGMRQGSKVSSSSDFALSSGLTFPMLMGTLIATSIGAASTLGRAGKAYDAGIAIALSGLAYGTGLLAFSWLGPILKKHDLWSLPDALGKRYGKPMRLIAAGVTLAALVGLFASQLIALGLTTTVMLQGTGIGFQTAVMACALVMIGYTLLGGMNSVAATDLVQAVTIVVVIGFILTIIMIQQIGGPVAAVETLIPQEGRWQGGLTTAFIVSLFLLEVPVVLIDAGLWQKAGAARQASHIRRAMVVTAILFIVWTFLTSAMGVFASVLLPDLHALGFGSDAALPQLVMSFVPPVLKGIVFAALIAVMLSTAATALLVAGTISGNELLRGLRPEADDRAILRTMRITIGIVALIGIGIALNMRGLFDLILIAVAIYVSGLFIPTMCALFWKGATKMAAYASSIGGTVTTLTLIALKQMDSLPSYIEPISGGMIVSGTLMFVVAKLTASQGERTPRLID